MITYATLENRIVSTIKQCSLSSAVKHETYVPAKSRLSVAVPSVDGDRRPVAGQSV
jgi:hypothetical protein